MRSGFFGPGDGKKANHFQSHVSSFPAKASRSNVCHHRNPLLLAQLSIYAKRSLNRCSFHGKHEYGGIESSDSLTTRQLQMWSRRLLTASRLAQLHRGQVLVPRAQFSVSRHIRAVEGADAGTDPDPGMVSHHCTGRELDVDV